MNTKFDFMKYALEMADKAKQQNEVPVGAVVVYQNEIIASGYNQTLTLNDPTAHAEVIALREASKVLNNYRLIDCDLYVTLEPCTMCVGAIIHARIKNLYFGAFDAKTGAVGSVINLFEESRLNHHTQYEGGILSAECGQILTDFFKARRLLKKQTTHLS